MNSRELELYFYENKSLFEQKTFRDFKAALYDLALSSGVNDNGYDTTANGWVRSYSGNALVCVQGIKFKAQGVKCGGDAWYATMGYIAFYAI